MNQNQKLSYVQLKEKHQKAFNAIPIKFAFSEEQFHRIFKEWGIDEANPDELKQVVSVGCGGYMLRSDVPKLKEYNEMVTAEKAAAIAADRDGTGYIHEMFYYELINHEYGYTCDVSDTLMALGYTMEKIESNPALLNGFTLAKNKIFEEA